MIRHVCFAAAVAMTALAPAMKIGPEPLAQAPASSAQQAPCSSPNHRQFDFWIGEWDVYRPDSALVGRSRIDTILGGCVIHEQWDSRPRTAGAPTVHGRSFSLFDLGAGAWHQSYVDNTGSILLLDGRLVGSAMIMNGERVGRDGRSSTYRITWTPVSGNEVRQFFEVSSDSGRTWQTAFDGRYMRRASGSAERSETAENGTSFPDSSTCSGR